MKKAGAISILLHSFINSLRGPLIFLALTSLTVAQQIDPRADAIRMNERLGNGLVFGSNTWRNDNNFDYEPADFEQTAIHDFNHARICGRLQNEAPRNAQNEIHRTNPVLPDETIDNLFDTVNWALDNDLIAVICPFFWWKGTDNPGQPNQRYNANLGNYMEPQAFCIRYPNDTNAQFNARMDADIEALALMWGQIAEEFTRRGNLFRQNGPTNAIPYEYTADQVVFELYEEPEQDVDVRKLIADCVDSIRAHDIAGDERYIVIPGRGFRTIVGMGRVFDANDIPVNDHRLIGTFHFYEPKCQFANIYQTACYSAAQPTDADLNLNLITWPEDESAINYPDDENLRPANPVYPGNTYNPGSGQTEGPFGFDALRSWFVYLDLQNQRWADRNSTTKLPVYMGEYGTLNTPSNTNGRIDIPEDQRQRYIWWARMMAEEFGYSTAYWNAYGRGSFGLGNGNKGNNNNGPDLVPGVTGQPAHERDMAFIQHALLGRYEAEDTVRSVAGIGGFTEGPIAQDEPAWNQNTSHNYVSFQGTAEGRILNFNNIYVGRDGTYNVTFRFANKHTTELYMNLESRQNGTTLTSLSGVPFTTTEGSDWYAKTVKMNLRFGTNNIWISGTTEDLRIDFVGVTHENKLFIDQHYDFADRDDRTESDTGLIFENRFESDFGDFTVFPQENPLNVVIAEAQSLLSRGGVEQSGVGMLDDSATASRIDSRSFSSEIGPGSTLYVQFDYLHKDNALNPAVIILNDSGQTALNINLKTGQGNVGYNSAGTLVQTDTALLANHWYRVTLTIPPVDSANDQCDLHIYKLSGGDAFEVEYTGLPAFQNDVDNLDVLRFRYSSGLAVEAGEYCIDNVLVTTAPEFLTYGAISTLTVQDGLRLHLDASRMAGVSDNESLTTIPNLAAFGSDVVTESFATAPTYQTNAMNGRPVMRFDGDNDWLDLGNLGGPVDAFEAFVVAYSDDTSPGNDTFQNIMSAYDGINSRFEAPNWRIIRPNNGDGGVAGDVDVSILSLDSGIIQNPGNVNAFTVDGINLARRTPENAAATPANHFAGDIAEVIIFDRILLDWEQKQVEYYLARKYGMNIPDFVNLFDDTDEDGVADIDELVAGTSITDPDSFFSAEFGVSNGNFQMRLDTEFERNYTFWRTEDFITWTQIDSATGNDLEQIFEESINAGEEASFFRVDVEHPRP